LHGLPQAKFRACNITHNFYKFNILANFGFLIQIFIIFLAFYHFTNMKIKSFDLAPTLGTIPDSDRQALRSGRALAAADSIPCQVGTPSNQVFAPPEGEKEGHPERHSSAADAWRPDWIHGSSQPYKLNNICNSYPTE
jgi:hypothetical protein